jgi:flagellar biosynthesis protein FlhA
VIASLFPRPSALLLPGAILTIIVLMVMPIPAMMLDGFFVLNIALSVAVLMAAMNALKPLDFSSFPSVLLFATLLRLALNVASTRIVLVNGHEGGSAAGHVIEAFGTLLVGGNFIVGLFVFLIVTVINLVVVTKGAGRVSEVSARFTLDALPGKQMAIDADLAAGLLSSEEAKARRRELATEADFYGSMDGSSKFVKGDAIAGLLIFGLNVIAGFCLGMFSHGLSAGVSAERYVTLAVGDALVAQVPALLLSIATAVIVTRVSDSRDLSGQIGGQFANPAIWLPVAGILLVLGLVPAMPQTVFLPAAAAAGYIWWRLKTARRPVAEPVAVMDLPDASRIAIGEVSDHTLVTIEVGYGLVHLINEARGSPLAARITGVRKQLCQELGFIVPQFRIRDALEMPPEAYRVLLGGVPLGGSQVRPGKVLAIDAGDVLDSTGLQGEATTDPSFNCPALWIDRPHKDRAVALGYLVVDADTVIATHLNQLLRQHRDRLLGPDQVFDLLQGLKEHAAQLVETVYPQPLTLAAITRILRALLHDGIPLSHPVPILTSLSVAVQSTLDHHALVDAVRADLGGLIVGRVCRPDETLPVITLHAALEEMILQGLRDPVTGEPVIEPALARNIGESVARLVSQIPAGHCPPALVVQPPTRRAMAALLRVRAPECLVLSIAELPPSQPIEVLAVIGDDPAPPAGLTDQTQLQPDVESVAA